jgi:mitochondrial-processing peptidase subunit beta
LSLAVTEAEVERAKAQLRASLLLSLDSTTPVAEDIGRQLVTTGRRMSPEEIEKVVGEVTVADVRRVANEKLWDQDLAISARNSPSLFVLLINLVGPIEGLLDYQRIRSDMSINAW